jgi:NAD(P)H-flavin reductase
MPHGYLRTTFLDERRAAAHIACDAGLVPAPGRYLLAHDPASDAPLPVPVFSSGLLPDGFLAASPLPRAWTPGTTLSLRGPLGHGFSLPANARKVALAAWEVSPAYLLGLLDLARRQDASISLVCADPPEDLPADVEIRPLAALAEVAQWADYLALAIVHTSLPGWRERFGSGEPLKGPRETQVLIVAPMPCGGLAQCGVCAVPVKRGNVLACEDGPVFALAEVL